MPKILIADDDTDLCDFLREELNEAGFTATTVNNGADAIVLIAEQSFDLVLLDMLMPGLNGIQTIRVLRKVAPDLPILGLTGYVGRGYMAEAAEYGVTCLSKPVIVDDLIDEINQVLSG